MKRRDLLKGTFAAGSMAALAARGEEDFPGILDTNVNLFRWPFRRLPLDETEKLVAKLRSLGITKALAGSYEGVFHRDLSAANARLAGECSRFPEFVPVASINPSTSGWVRDLEAARTAIRLHPGYHGYGLDHPGFADLLLAAAERGLLVQLAVALEDPRTQPELMRVPEVDLSPIAEAMAKEPKAKVQLLNWKGRGTLTNTLRVLPNLFVDTALADGTDAVATLVKTFGPERVLFGTHAPFLIPEAALLRVHEAGLAEEDERAILRGNAEPLIRDERA
jgi:predicted TIM-barrel fold metal-dependent hydrolase